MRINKATVTYSSIVKIGEEIQKLENETGLKYLKLHRGVMDVTNIDINSVNINLDLNSLTTQQYSGNDGHPKLIEAIREDFNIKDNVIITPGGMAALDLIINSLDNNIFWIPNFHWGSWNKILKTHDKDIKTFDDFSIDNFRPRSGVVMLCYPSNPTGYCPDFKTLKTFIDYTKDNNITVILDLPYYHLFNGNEISELLYDNVILVSSFSKSIGLSGYRIGFISTKNNDLYQTLKIRSLYKYNSISTLPQIIISELLKEKKAISNYRNITVEHITKNIKYLTDNGLLFNEYTSIPIGPFAVISIGYEKLLEYKISSVPINNFSLIKMRIHDNCSRISVAVNHDLFKEYFDRLLK
jgi:aspartate/methionine/tyrosine aminotransferase